MHCDKKCILFEDFGRREGTLHTETDTGRVIERFLFSFLSPFQFVASLSAWAAKMRELGDRNSWRPTSEGGGEYNIGHI